MSPRRGTTTAGGDVDPLRIRTTSREQQRVSARVLPDSQSVSGDIDMVLIRKGCGTQLSWLGAVDERPPDVQEDVFARAGAGSFGIPTRSADTCHSWSVMAVS